MIQFVPIASNLLTGYNWEEPASVFLTPSGLYTHVYVYILPTRASSSPD